MAPGELQEDSKMAPSTVCNCTLFGPSQGPLGALLKLSWSLLGALLGPFEEPRGASGGSQNHVGKHGHVSPPFSGSRAQDLGGPGTAPDGPSTVPSPGQLH